MSRPDPHSNRRPSCQPQLRQGVLALALAVLVILAGCSTATGAPSEPKSTGPPTLPEEAHESAATELNATLIEQEIFRLTNEERAKRGIGAYEHDSHAAAVARHHSWDMYNRGYYSHESPEGDDVTNRLFDGNYKYHAASSENLAKIRWFVEMPPNETEVAKSLVEAWMNSPGHREAILRENYENLGVGVYVGQDGTLYATQVFTIQWDK